MIFEIARLLESRLTAINHGRPARPVGRLDQQQHAAEAAVLGMAVEGASKVVSRMLAARSIDSRVTADADLRDIGLTSLDMIDLVLSLERELALEIPESHITPANFRSISTIDALLASLRN
jgi:acyl carrier protein